MTDSEKKYKIYYDAGKGIVGVYFDNQLLRHVEITELLYMIWSVLSNIQFEINKIGGKNDKWKSYIKPKRNRRS